MTLDEAKWVFINEDLGPAGREAISVILARLAALERVAAAALAADDAEAALRSSQERGDGGGEGSTEAWGRSQLAWGEYHRALAALRESEGGG